MCDAVFCPTAALRQEVTGGREAMPVDPQRSRWVKEARGPKPPGVRSSYGRLLKIGVAWYKRDSQAIPTYDYGQYKEYKQPARRLRGAMSRTHVEVPVLGLRERRQLRTTPSNHEWR
jgi:hypothetical protein